MVKRKCKERCTISKSKVPSIPQAYRSLLISDMRKVKPEAIQHFSHELTKVKPPQERHIPTLIVVGQQEAFVTKHAAYEMRRALPGARGVLVPGIGHFWNLEAPDLFTKTVRAWIQDEPLPPNLAQFSAARSY